MAELDPHRSRCWWSPTNSSWLSLLDWAVYHAPSWHTWQAFRASLVGTPMKDRLTLIRSWRADRNFENWPFEDLIRVTNLLRSLRGQFTDYPELRQELETMNPALEAALRKYKEEGAHVRTGHDS